MINSNHFPEDAWVCDVQSIDIVKGWTRSTVIATFLVAFAELDLSDPVTRERLKPLHKLVDKCWLVPVHVLWCQW